MASTKAVAALADFSFKRGRWSARRPAQGQAENQGRSRPQRKDYDQRSCHDSTRCAHLARLICWLPHNSWRAGVPHPRPLNGSWRTWLEMVTRIAPRTACIAPHRGVQSFDVMAQFQPALGCLKLLGDSRPTHRASQPFHPFQSFPFPAHHVPHRQAEKQPDLDKQVANPAKPECKNSDHP